MSRTRKRLRKEVCEADARPHLFKMSHTVFGRMKCNKFQQKDAKIPHPFLASITIWGKIFIKIPIKTIKSNIQQARYQSIIRDGQTFLLVGKKKKEFSNLLEGADLWRVLVIHLIK